MLTAGFVLTGLASALAAVAAVLVLKLRPEDFREEYDGGALPRLVKAQRWPTVLGLVSAACAIVGTALLAASR